MTCYYPSVRGIIGRICVAMLLATCVGFYTLEMTGRWDRSIQDANDEAGFVAIVLCVGVALSFAGATIAHIRSVRSTAFVVVANATASSRTCDRRAAHSVSTSSPPLPLRI